MARCCRSAVARTRTFIVPPAPIRVPLLPRRPWKHFPREKLWMIFLEERQHGKMWIEPWPLALYVVTMKVRENWSKEHACVTTVWRDRLWWFPIGFYFHEYLDIRLSFLTIFFLHDYYPTKLTFFKCRFEVPTNRWVSFTNASNAITSGTINKNDLAITVYTHENNLILEWPSNCYYYCC